MSNIYSLETLKSELDAEFAPLQLDLGKERLTLRNLMRINDKDRESVLNALEEIDKAEKDKPETPEGEEPDFSTEEVTLMGNALTTIFLAVTANGKGQKLVDYIDGDIPLAMKIMNLWTEATQPGEAQNSSD